MTKKIALAAAALAAVLAAASRPAQEGKPPLKIGVINLKTCFEKEKYDRIRDVDADVQKMVEDHKKEVAELEKQIKNLKEQLEALDPGQLLYTEKLKLLRRAESDLKITRDAGQNRFRDQYSEIKIELYNEIRRVVSLVGQEQKFDLILRVEEPELKDDDPEGVNQRISSRVVLYNQDSLDLTPAVLDRLNQEWKLRWECPKCKKKATGAACPACGAKKP